MHSYRSVKLLMTWTRKICQDLGANRELCIQISRKLPQFGEFNTGSI
jgi:hypothetical protein